MSIVLCGPNCTSEQKNSGRGCGDPQESYIGAVLDMWEVNGSSDSDFYALVWDNATESCKTVEYASTRGWTYHNGAKVDASESVEVAARRWYIPRVRAIFVRHAEEEAARVRRGDIVRSTTKRGKNVGVTGKVRRMELDTYKTTSYREVYRYAIEVIGEDSFRWLSADAVEKVDIPAIDVEAEHRRADAWTWSINWRSLTWMY